MNRKDILCPPPGSYTSGGRQPFTVTSTGDLVLTSGDPSVRQWAMRMMLTAPGDFLTLPDFGGGGEEALGLPLSSQAGIRARIRRSALADPRIRDAVVVSEQTDDGRVALTLNLETVDGTPVPVGVRLP